MRNPSHEGIHGRPALAGLLLVAIALPGCADEFCLPDSEPVVARSTRISLLEAFDQAHVQRDIGQFLACLHPDYEFWFAADVQASSLQAK